VEPDHVVSYLGERQWSCLVTTRLAEHPPAPADLGESAATAKFLSDEPGPVPEVAGRADLAGNVLGETGAGQKPSTRAMCSASVVASAGGTAACAKTTWPCSYRPNVSISGGP